MVEKEIQLDGKKIKIDLEIPFDKFDNNNKIDIENTLDLSKEIKKIEKEVGKSNGNK